MPGDTGDVSKRARARRRFWLIYVAAWLPYAASYVAIFLVQNSRRALWMTVVDMLYSVASAALLGLLVLWFCRKLPWSLHRRPWFFVAHLIGAALYSAAWLGAVTALLTMASTVQRGKWTPLVFGGYALQWQLFSGLMIYGTLASVSYVVQVADRLRREEARAARAEALRARAESLRTRAELEALRAQLNPHFLFNTLHTLMALLRRDPSAAEDALERFAGLLRHVLNLRRESLAGGDGPDDVPLGDEWEFVRNYLALEGLRLGARLRVVAEVDEGTLRCPVPAFTLQPLVENAIKHGIAPRADGGTLRIHAAYESGPAGDTLRIEIADDGAGASTERLSEAGGLGLRVVRHRLEIRYGGRAEFRVDTAPGAGFGVIMRLPVETDARRVEEEEEEAWQFAR